MGKSEAYQRMADGTMEWVAVEAYIDDEMTQEDREKLHTDWVIEVAIAKRFGEDSTTPRKEKVLKYLEQVKGISIAKTNSKPRPILPDQLNTNEAMKYWERAKQAGFVNKDYSFNGTNYQMAYFAERFGEKLKLKNKWKPFIELWHFKYFPQTRRESTERFGYVERQQEIDQIFID